MKKDKTLQNARLAWVLKVLDEQKLDKPVNELVSKTGFSKGAISSMLSGRYAISMEFFNKFCESFDYDPQAANHMIIDEAKKRIENNVNSGENEVKKTDDGIQNISDTEYNTQLQKMLSSLSNNDQAIMENVFRFFAETNRVKDNSISTLVQTNSRMSNALLDFFEERTSKESSPPVKNRLAR